MWYVRKLKFGCGKYTIKGNLVAAFVVMFKNCAGLRRV
jgi:hypothetical protein